MNRSLGDFMFSLRHKSYKVTSKDFTSRSKVHREELAFADVANVSSTEAFPWNWP